MIDFTGIFISLIFLIIALSIFGCFALYFGADITFKDFKLTINPERAKEPARPDKTPPVSRKEFCALEDKVSMLAMQVED